VTVETPCASTHRAGRERRGDHSTLLRRSRDVLPHRGGEHSGSRGSGRPGPVRRNSRGGDGNRTRDRGFAVPCLTTWPPRRDGERRVARVTAASAVVTLPPLDRGGEPFERGATDVGQIGVGQRAARLPSCRQSSSAQARPASSGKPCAIPRRSSIPSPNERTPGVSTSHPPSGSGIATEATVVCRPPRGPTAPVRDRRRARARSSATTSRPRVPRHHGPAIASRSRSASSPSPDDAETGSTSR
jgi:hypothetical protein